VSAKVTFLFFLVAALTASVDHSSAKYSIRRFRLSYQLMHGLALLEECVSDPESIAAL
jgi:hypothetical protein